MATVSEQRNRQGQLIGWRVQIRRRGWPAVSKVFDSRKDADDWATVQEAAMVKGQYVNLAPAERLTLREIVEAHLISLIVGLGVRAAAGDESAVVSLRRLQRRDPESASRRTRHPHAAAIDRKGAESECYRLLRILEEERELVAYTYATLRPRHIDKWKQARLGDVSPSAMRREMTVLDGALEAARKRLELPASSNPMRDVERPSPADERDVRLSPAQWKRLLEECRKEPMRAGPWKKSANGKKVRPLNHWLAPAVELLRETGARRSELLRWRWKDTDLKKGVAVFRDVKNSRAPETTIDRQIGLSRRAIAILKSLPRSTDGRVIPLTIDTLKQGFERARERADVPHFRLHDARHELASSLTEAGWSPVEVMAQGGWRDPKSMKRYTNLTGKHLAARFRGRPARRA